MSFQYVKEIGAPDNLPFKEALKNRVLEGAGNSVSSTPVPPNEVWEVTHINCDHDLVADESAKIDILNKAGIVHRVHMELATQEIEWSGHLWLNEGDYIRVSWDTADNNKTLNIHGIKRTTVEAALASRKLRLDLILPKEVDVQEPGPKPDPEM